MEFLSAAFATRGTRKKTIVMSGNEILLIIHPPVDVLHPNRDSHICCYESMAVCPFFEPSRKHAH
jgi:hypothetical protein